MYERLEGRWRDLLNRLKWDTIKSAVKSVAGLQGRKFKARPQASAPPVPCGCVPSLCWDWMWGAPRVRACGLLSRRPPCPRQITRLRAGSTEILQTRMQQTCSHIVPRLCRRLGMPLSVHEHHFLVRLEGLVARAGQGARLASCGIPLEE